MVNETDATERGIEYYLDINSKRLDFDFYSTLGPVDLVTVTTGPCYKARKFRLRHNYNLILQNLKLHELTNVKLGKWYNAGVEDIIDLATKVVSKAFPTMSVQAIYLKPQISSIKFNPKTTETKLGNQKTSNFSMALLVSGCVFVAYLLFGFVIHRRQRMGVCSNHIKRFWPATLDALVFRIFSIKKSVIRGLILLIATALMLLVYQAADTSWHEVLPVLIYLLIAVAMFCISK